MASETGGADGGPGWRGRISGANIVSGSGTASLSSISATGAIWFNGEDNATYGRGVSHAVPGGAIGQNDFTAALTFQCPTKSSLATYGHCLWILSASNPSSTLNSSISAWLVGSNSNGTPGAAEGSLVLRAQNSSGGDLLLVVPGFADSYGGTVVRLRISRERSATDFLIKVFANAALLGRVDNGSGNDFGLNLGSGAFWFTYGFGSLSGIGRPFRGYISQAGLVPAAVSSAQACADFDRDFPHPYDVNHRASIIFPQLVPTTSEVFSNASSHLWTDLTKAGDSFTEQGGAAITVSAGDSSSWFRGRINETGNPNTLRLTASASAATNRCRLTSVTSIQRRYLVKITVRQVSGTAADLLVGFDLDNRRTTDQNFRFTPTSVAATFTGVVAASGTASLFIALADDSAAAGQVFEVTRFQVFNQACSVYADFSIGDGYIVRNLGTPASDVLLDTAGNPDWVPRKRFANHVIQSATDQSVTSSTTLVNSQLTFRMAAYATYNFSVRGYFQLLGSTSGYKFAMAGPSGVTYSRACAFALNTVTNAFADIALNTSLTTALAGALTDTGRHLVSFEGTVTAGATAGDLVLQFAQNTSHGSAITLEAGSTMTLTRIS